MDRVLARAFPRVGLLGNPSDGYGGRVLAFTFEDFEATVAVTGRASGIDLHGPDGRWTGHDPEGLAQALATGLLPGGASLLGAALFQRPGVTDLALEFTSNIPRQVGLAGSSAIVVAALRAIDLWTERPDDPFEVSESALRAETGVLGVTAGPQDRVAQAYGGFLDMDFHPPRHAAAYRKLDPGLLPPLWVAYDPAPGTSSGVSHADIKGRYERGDPAVRGAIARFVELAGEGAQALAAGNASRLADLLDESFDTRAAIWPLTDVDRRLVSLAREAGSAAKLCGSGGAIVLLPRPDAPTPVHLFEEAGFACLSPRISPPSP